MADATFDPKAKWVGKRRKGPRPRPNWYRPFLLGGRIDGLWMQRAIELRQWAPLAAGVALWYLRGLNDSTTVDFASIEAERWGLDKDSKHRGLKALEKAGLVKLASKRGKNPTVTLLRVK